jgi:hypothetical protein
MIGLRQRHSVREIGGDALAEFGGSIAFRLLSAVAFKHGLQLRALDAQGAVGRDLAGDRDRFFLTRPGGTLRATKPHSAASRPLNAVPASMASAACWRPAQSGIR